MKRILAILILMIVLLDGPHPKIERPLLSMDFLVGPRPIWVPVDLAARGYGPLRLFGLWELQSENTSFGGISALLVRSDGELTAVNDSAVHIDFGIGIDAGDARMEPLPLEANRANDRFQTMDTESVAIDPASRQLWVGFEDGLAICRFSPNFEQVQGCVRPKAMAQWSPRQSIESLVRFGDGRFLAIEEGTTGAGGRHDVLLWAGDPVDRRTPEPVHLSYQAPAGFAPTDALWLGGDRLLVLNRRLSLFEGFTAKLVMVRLPRLAAGAVLRGEVITDFRSPGPVDNLEAMALGKEASGPALWIASDNNHLFFQKTLLYRFSIPSDWVSDRPAP